VEEQFPRERAKIQSILPPTPQTIFRALRAKDAPSILPPFLLIPLLALVLSAPARRC
jgi:hypothetical protein